MPIDQSGFEVDNRGKDIFVMLTYPREITAETRFRVGDAEYTNLQANVAFVALKNGEHDGAGYFIDTGIPKGSLPKQISLTDIPHRIAEALNVGFRVPA